MAHDTAKLSSEAPVPSRSALLDTLDTLLEQYLHLIDTYTKAQQQLSSHLQSGYMSLAKANFDSSNRTNYGQDYYDSRMQALRRARIDEGGEEDVGKTAIRLSVVTRGAGQERGTGERKEDSDARVQLLSPPSTPAADEQEDEDTGDPVAQEEPTLGDEETARIQDPIRMFGILVPRALRSAQGSFTAAVTDPIPSIINVNREMRTLENEIGRLRKQIRKT